MELAEGQDPTQLSQEEKAAYKAVAKVKGQIWEMLLAFERGEINLADRSDDLKKLIAEYVHLDEEVKASAIYRKKAEKARRAIAHNEHQSQMIELKKQRPEPRDAEIRNLDKDALFERAEALQRTVDFVRVSGRQRGGVMTKDEMLAAARSFEIKPGEYDDHPIMVESARQSDGSLQWKVMQRGFALNKKGGWDYEPQPSSRTEAYFRAHRWLTLDEAIEAAVKCEV